ncbi:MAG: response regulator transcription factor, partial [Bacillota bacterium]
MRRHRILVVDDEHRMRELVRLYLAGAGYEVAEAADGREALDRLRREAFDLVILDLMLPGLDGWEVCRRLREESDLPVIMLTARGEVDDRVQGLRLGADDYIAKPFDGREVVARVEAVLRRSQPLAASDRPLRVGDLTIHPASRTVTWRGQPVHLTPREFDLLHLLAAHPGQVFTRERLLDRIWGPDFEGDPRTVDSHIKNLREKLGDGAALVVTV